MVKLADNGAGLLLEILNGGYSRGAWHGPTLKQSLRGVSARSAAWRPNPGRHNIWELAVHAAYWKYTVRRKLLGEKRGTFVLEGSNWFTRPIDPSEKAWKADLALLDSEHHKLREAMKNYLESRKEHVSTRLLYGIAFHDVYHAGQIRLLRRLQEQVASAGTSRRRSAQ